MNLLLKRQIGKHLKNGLNHMDQFLESIDNSYKNYEDQIAILQHSMKISSDELYEANQKLRAEADSLKEINKNLEFILNSMNLDTITNEPLNEFNSSDYIKHQTIEIIKINKQREELLYSLEKQNQSLNEYAHIVSHDLKSPLRSIHSLITWIQEDNEKIFDEKTSNYFSLIQKKVEKMNHLIQGILTYTKIDKVNIIKEEIDLNDLVNNIVNMIFIPSHVEIVIKNKLPIIRNDAFRMQQLFQNLISNAINFNDKPTGFVDIAFVENEMEYIFSIKDNGVGISDKDQEKIFQIFESITVDDKSTGIGLSIVKRILDNSNEKIWLESQENIGTAFFFTLHK
ncbi:ATP-binding protein [Flavobacterium sp.]|jgi:light-regulated signal transduction histidine kinase (bacteriophytochrome)|uniref:sensor histidine kinase n=1 Tax=Flavobacterium sp. TaxID=239 RepID=UPI0037C00588